MLSKPFLFTTLSIALLSGCTVVNDAPITEPVTTTTSVDGVPVTSFAYKCRVAQSDSDYQAQFEIPFLIEYSGKDNENATLVERSGSYPLVRVKSASGAKYASVDGMQEFWGKGDSAMITFNHETFNDCYLVK
ncbi:MliC family protein [Vibrio aphrogenes]|uniref:MliC family protein n=1 Tax=Vibrio aphrogenes TaxID=1891186 RepID=UPI000B3533EC|nr:MliC family protein [Vibrio aphrogenes]